MKKNSPVRTTRLGSSSKKSSAKEADKGWSKIKSKLTGLRRDALIRLVHDLYAANADNRAFLHARFGSAEDSLEPYMKTISRWVNPDPLRNQDVSISRAKKAISDYKKAIGRPEGIVELSVYYCEACTDFINSWPGDDEPYYDALIRMFERALIAIDALDLDLRQPFIKRLEKVADNYEDFGYGIVYEMHDLMYMHGMCNYDESNRSG